MIGVCYLLLALGCWTVWAVLSARLGGRFSPLNSLLWTGLVSALITLGGFAIHFRQLRVPCKADWWLLAIFCGANTIACFGYYAALRHLPGSVVLPFSHLYLVIGPLVLAIRDRQALGWQQFAALCIIMGGLVLFLAAAPSSDKQQTELIESKPGRQSAALSPFTRGIRHACGALPALADPETACRFRKARTLVRLSFEQRGRPARVRAGTQRLSTDEFCTPA